MNAEKYNKYAAWYEKERKLSAVAIYSGDTKKIKEHEETLLYIKELMQNEYEKTIGSWNKIEIIHVG